MMLFVITPAVAVEVGTYGLRVDQDGWAMLDVYPGGRRCVARFRAIGFGEEGPAWREGPPVVPIGHGSLVHAALPPGFPDNRILIETIDLNGFHVWQERGYDRVRGVAVIEDSYELRAMAFPYCDLTLLKNEFHERLPRLPRDGRRGWVAILVEYALYEKNVSLDDAATLFPPARRCVRRAECGAFIDLSLTRPPPSPWEAFPLPDEDQGAPLLPAPLPAPE